MQELLQNSFSLFLGYLICQVYGVLLVSECDDLGFCRCSCIERVTKFRRACQRILIVAYSVKYVFDEVACVSSSQIYL